ncbi:MAG: PAS domain-containing protein [Rhizomicrobium sp.]|nr:PAS domain-containing protein [Rhizomicrobium sp.]
MSFTDFFAAISAEPLKAVANHWQEARGQKPMPSWHDIQPSHIAAQLKLVWVYKYDPVTELFTGRLAGNVIEAVFGKSFRGTPMKELYPGHDYDRLYSRARRVIAEPALYRGDGKVFEHFERIGSGERIILPLANDGAHGDGILGATIYEMATGVASDDTGENERWFGV